MATRLGRQAVWSRPRAPQFLAILDEAVLRRPVAGSEVMMEQIRHIIAQTRRPNVDVRVVPFVAGVHTGLDGTHMTLEFAKTRTIVHLENKRSSLFLDEPEVVASYCEATDTLLQTALGPTDSLDFLASVADDYGKG